MVFISLTLHVRVCADLQLGCTALHLAALRGHTDTCAALLDCGADIDTVDKVKPLGIL